MNTSFFEIENTRVPVLLIGLSEISLLEGNRILVTVTAIILMVYLKSEIVAIKGNGSEKEMKEKQRIFKMAMHKKSLTSCLQILHISFCSHM